MEMTELRFAAVRRSYERGRIRWALVVAALVFLLPCVSWMLSGRTWSQLVLGMCLCAAIALAAWLGQAWGRGASIGLIAGLAPLALAHAARMIGHVCTGSGCTSLCVPACALGGALAGGIAFLWAKRSPNPPLTLGAATGVAILTGALGCSCVGFTGVVALVAAMVGTVCVGRLALPSA